MGSNRHNASFPVKSSYLTYSILNFTSMQILILAITSPVNMNTLMSTVKNAAE